MSSPFGTPPAPPPKPSGHSSGVSTPNAAASASAAHRPAPPIPSQQSALANAYGGTNNRPIGSGSGVDLGNIDDIQGPEQGWLPDLLKDKSTADLQSILASPQLQHALIHAPQTCHPSIPLSTQHLHSLLAANTQLASSLVQQEQHLSAARQHTQSRLLALRALERQWKQRQTDQDTALRDFSASALYQRLAAAVGEQDALCRALEEGWLEGEEDGGVASEREVADFVRRTREARKVGYLRRERKERWDEGRIGGWRG